MALSEKALVVTAIISSTTLKKTDKEAGLELAERKHASAKSTKVVKELIKSSHLQGITSVMSAFRAYLKSNTVPWLGDTYLLPCRNLFEFTDKVENFKRLLDEEVEHFISVYDQLIEQQRDELGELFEMGAYPYSYDLRNKFIIEVTVMPLPDNSQFTRLGLDEDTSESLREKALEVENGLLKKATEDLFKRVKIRLEMLLNRLSDPETRRYKESLVTGLSELVEALPELNINEDQRIGLMVDDLRIMLASFTLDDVRADKEVRNNTATACKDILDKMTGWL